MDKEKLEINLLSICLLFVLSFPSYHYLPIDGLPFDSFIELFLLSITILLSRHIYSLNKKITIFLFLLLLASKTALLIEPPTYWKSCFIDDLAPRTEQFSYEDIEIPCEKSFSVPRSSVSGYEHVIEFKSIDSSQIWRGANNSTFPLSFFNSGKFNLDRSGEPRRDWLPFQGLFFGIIDEEIRYLKFSYIGEVSLKFDNKIAGFGFPSSYKEQADVLIPVPNGVKNIKVDYKFNKFPRVLADKTQQLNYPPDPYGMLVIYGSQDGLEWSLLENEKSSVYVVAFYIFTASLFLIFFYFLCRKFKDLNSAYFINILLLLLLLYLYFNMDLLRKFPVLYFLDLSTVFLLLIAFAFVYFSRNKLNNYFLLIFSYLFTLLMVEYPWGIIDLYIRPGGSDILRYESNARLILLGDGLRGGEDVFWGPPGYRYILSALHVFFGDTWIVVWVTLVSICLFFFVKTSLSLLGDENLLKLLFPMLGIVYLTSNGVLRVFRFGMSEIISTTVLFILLYFILTESSLSESLKVFIGVLFGLGVVVRPDWLFGFVALLLFQKFRYTKIYIITLIISLLPLIHNLYFGRSFVIFSSSANYSRNLLVDTSSISNFLPSLLPAISNNIPYFFMSPFNSDVSGRVGSILPFVFLLIILLSFGLFVLRFKHLPNQKTVIFFISIFGFLSPFLVYDVVLFYPRHVLGAHITLIYFLIYLVASPVRDYSFRVITKERI